MKKITIIGALIGLWGLSSCERFLEVERPIDKQVSEYVFSNDETAEAAGLGLYLSLVRLGERGFTGMFTVRLGMTSDELYYTSSGWEEALQLRENRLSPEGNSNMWQGCFETIYHANLFLEEMEKAEKVSLDLRIRLSGEAKFIRALSYFYMVNIYGDLPLINSSDYHKNGNLFQSPKANIYKFILQDLEDAYQILATDYLVSEPIRANKWAVAALLARVHLYLEDWELAEKYAREVIESSAYSLVSVDEIGLNSNREAILQVANSMSFGANNAEVNMLLSVGTASGQPSYSVDTLLVNAFSGDDLRMAWIAEQIAADGTQYHLARKYKVRSTPNNAKRLEHLTVLRLGEQHLILAEALVQKELFEDAIEQLDIIRERAGITLLKGLNITKTKENLIDLILEERQRELCFELGHRWFDLNRTGRADAYFSSLSYKDWQPTDRYFPIPESEILLNPFLKQNPGYE